MCISADTNAWLLGKTGMAGDLVELREICLAALVWWCEVDLV
jgi:hypothetical protein